MKQNQDQVSPSLISPPFLRPAPASKGFLFLFFCFLQASPGLYSASERLVQQRAENRKQPVLLVPSFPAHTEVLWNWNFVFLFIVVLWQPVWWQHRCTSFDQIISKFKENRENRSRAQHFWYDRQHSPWDTLCLPPNTLLCSTDAAQDVHIPPQTYLKCTVLVQWHI